MPVTPSWSGDSIGHYEGDTLVIDTVGVKVRPLSMIDLLGTPQSEAVHVVERYRLIEGEAAIETDKGTERDNIRIPGDAPIGDGAVIDPDYTGKGLQLQFTVDDSVFTTAWSAGSTYRRALGDWVERICAENPHEYYSGRTPQFRWTTSRIFEQVARMSLEWSIDPYTSFYRARGRDPG